MTTLKGLIGFIIVEAWIVFLLYSGLGASL